VRISDWSSDVCSSDLARHVRGGGPFEPLSPRSQPPERDEDRMERDECVADEERDRQCPSTELIGLSLKDALHDAAPTTSGDAGDEIGEEIGGGCCKCEEDRKSTRLNSSH